MYLNLMFRSIHSVALYGMDGIPIRVEADVRDGFPSFEMLGYLSGQVKEAGGRVRSALHNSGYSLAPKRVCINLSPANVKKEGNAFDLPIAVAILASIISISEEKLNETMFVGELGLDGSVRRIPGILPVVKAAREAGIHCCVVPRSNLRETAVLNQIQVIGVDSLSEVVELLLRPEAMNERKISSEKREWEEFANKSLSTDEELDFSDVAGQQNVRRALEVAVSGRHHFLMIGTAGAGKTMLARRIPGILPVMTREEQLEVSCIYSSAGLLDESHSLVRKRPFRAPHHSITRPAMMGGGRIPKAGEISLAHKGVLFLDELPEFQNETLEALRQPMEENKITLNRTYGSITYPAEFLTVAAMNPCKCGYYPDRTRCRCDEAQVYRYLNRVSGPLLERMDLITSVEPISWEQVTNNTKAESSEQIRKRVERSWEIQRERFRGTEITNNSQMNRAQVEEYCVLDPHTNHLLKNAFDHFGISARVYHKILKVSRTIADMSGSTDIREEHLMEAIHYRSAVNHFWNLS